MVGIEEILALEHLEKDIFRGAVHPTALQRTFGGQVAGQSLVSAVSTVDESYHVHSLHGYFLRPGNPKIPTVYLVDRIRDGRSFCTRRVNAVQDGKTIFTMSASFHVDDEGIEHQDRMPSVPARRTCRTRRPFRSWLNRSSIRSGRTGTSELCPLSRARQRRISPRSNACGCATARLCRIVRCCTSARLRISVT